MQIGKIHFSENDVKNTIFSLKEDFAIVSIDNAANNVAFICKHFYAIKELNFDYYLSDQNDTNNYTFKNNKDKSQIIYEWTPFHDFLKTSSPINKRREWIHSMLCIHPYLYKYMDIYLSIYTYIYIYIQI